ncbi:MAG: site-specific recombinase, partial [Patescibacteria group bacterium]|nr:site-specific recombinase [Patescibacteria group bacterium]
VNSDVSYSDIPDKWLDKVIVELRKRHDNQQVYYTQNIEQTRKEYDAIKGKMKTLYEDRLVGRITTDQYDEYVNDLENRQQDLNDRLKMLTSDNKSFQLAASYLLDLAQRAEQLFKESDEALQNKLLEYVLSNIELKDKKLSYMFNEPFRTIIETKKKSLSGSESNIWCG